MDNLVSMLDKIVENPKLAWNKSLNQKTHLLTIDFDKNSLNELDLNKNYFTERPIHQFPNLKIFLSKLKKELLLDGYGLFVLNGKNLKSFTNREIKQIFELICELLGNLYVQNIQGEKLVEIKNEGKSMTSGGRYHQTNEGGSYHTDSPQWKEVPDFIGLCCINPAKKGGTSKFVSTYTLHNDLLKNNPELLRELYQNFHFDKRGEFEENESPTTFAPIFSFSNTNLSFRYLRNYINDGQKLQNLPLNQEQTSALDALDKLTIKDDNIVDYSLDSKDMVFFNNHRVLHGRTSFVDFDEDDKKRLLYRAWIKDL